jgi:hypothetical protein
MYCRSRKSDRFAGGTGAGSSRRDKPPGLNHRLNAGDSRDIEESPLALLLGNRRSVHNQAFPEYLLAEHKYWPVHPG